MQLFKTCQLSMHVSAKAKIRLRSTAHIFTLSVDLRDFTEACVQLLRGKWFAQAGPQECPGAYMQWRQPLYTGALLPLLEMCMNSVKDFQRFIKKQILKLPSDNSHHTLGNRCHICHM